MSTPTLASLVCSAVKETRVHTEGVGGFNETQYGVELKGLGVVLLEIDQ